MNAAIPVLIWVAAVQSTSVRNLYRTIEWRPGTTVVVSHRFGDVSVEGRKRNHIEVKARVKAIASSPNKAAALARLARLQTRRLDDTVVVSISVPSEVPLSQEEGWETGLVVVVPAATRVVVKNSFGNVMVTDVVGGGEIVNRFGDVSLVRCRNFEVVNRFGDVSVCRVSGSLAICNRFGSVSLDSVWQQVEVDNRYGEVRAQHLDGNASLSNWGGAISCRRSSGAVSIENHCGDVLAWVEEDRLKEIDIAAELGSVCLNLERSLSFHLDAATFAGHICSSLPLVLEAQGPHKFASGGFGKGGPVIRLSGMHADFVIAHDSLEER